VLKDVTGAGPKQFLASGTLRWCTRSRPSDRDFSAPWRLFYFCDIKCTSGLELLCYCVLYNIILTLTVDIFYFYRTVTALTLWWLLGRVVALKNQSVRIQDVYWLKLLNYLVSPMKTYKYRLLMEMQGKHLHSLVRCGWPVTITAISCVILTERKRWWQNAVKQIISTNSLWMQLCVDI